jgi:hypothetical protein
MIEFLAWFDITNQDHLKAYSHVCKTGAWPEGFIPENVIMGVTSWNVELMAKFTNAYIQEHLLG